MKSFFPNLITLCNLLCGTLGVIVILVPENPFGLPFYYAGILLLIAALFDFFDGAVARLLRVSSEIGKQLDSLADMVSFGLLPGLMVYQWIHQIPENTHLYFAYIGFLVPLFSAYRLAKFNIDSRQSDHFIGIPTPANALLITSFWLIIAFQPDSFIIPYIQSPLIVSILVLTFCLLMVSDIPLLALKFKDLKWENNYWRFLLIIISIGLITFFYFTAIPFIILLYLLISIVKNKIER